MASSGIRRCVHLPDLSPCHLVCHFATSLCAKAKLLIQLHTQVLNVFFPLNLMFPENDLRVLEGSPVRDQQSLFLFRGHFQAFAIQLTLCPSQTFIDSQLQDSDVLSYAHDKCVIREADDACCSR